MGHHTGGTFPATCVLSIVNAQAAQPLPPHPRCIGRKSCGRLWWGMCQNHLVCKCILGSISALFWRALQGGCRSWAAWGRKWLQRFTMPKDSCRTTGRGKSATTCLVMKELDHRQSGLTVLFEMLKKQFKMHQMLVSRQAGPQAVVQTDIYEQAVTQNWVHRSLNCLCPSFQAKRHARECSSHVDFGPSSVREMWQDGERWQTRF